MKTLIKAILAVISLSIYSNLWANTEKPQLYQIEILIFQQPEASGFANENWPQHPTLPVTSQSKELTTASSNVSEFTPFTYLPRKELLLYKEQYRLETNLGAKILLHYAWYQPLDNKTNIHIYSPLSSDESEQANQQYFSSNQYNWTVDGTLAISANNYINITTNLAFNLASSQDQRTLPQTMVINQKRRLKENEVHYIDNPAIGIILVAKPLETS